MKFIDNIKTAHADKRYFKAAMAHDKNAVVLGRDKLSTNAVLEVPGYSESTGAFKIFVQPTKWVDTESILSNILLCIADNPDYPDDLFFVCGTKFTKLPLADQLATIERELIRCDCAVKFDVRNPYDIWDMCDMDDGCVVDYVRAETKPMEGYMYVALAGAFGERVARRVMRREHNLEMKSARPAGRFQEEYARRIDDLYTAKKPNQKKVRKSGKAARKTVKPEGRTIKKANAAEWKAKAKEWKAEIEKVKADRKTDTQKPEAQPEAESDDFDIKTAPAPQKVVDFSTVREKAEAAATEIKETVGAVVDEINDMAKSSATADEQLDTDTPAEAAAPTEEAPVTESSEPTENATPSEDAPTDEPGADEGTTPAGQP